MSLAKSGAFLTANLVSSKQARISERFRGARDRFFLELLARVPRPCVILDVGGTPEYWYGIVPARIQVGVLNTFPQTSTTEQVVPIVGDGCDLPYADKSFEVVFSSSALAFVGSRPRQRLLAHEIRRVGRRYFVQTPNQAFPLDWRTLVPCFHWLTPEQQARILCLTGVGRYRKASNYPSALGLTSRVLDVTRQELAGLFPDGTIESERLLGLTKSFMVHHGF
jgi:Methyltransferase domain